MPINLADGHARHRLTDEVLELVGERFRSLLTRVPDVEQLEAELLHALASHTRTKYMRKATWVSYSASVAIDVVSKLLLQRRSRVALVSPTFDNLAGLLLLAGNHLTSLDEQYLFPTVDFGFLDSLAVDSLFLVVPNNPTGKGHTWDRSEWARLLEWSASRRKLLVVDMAFRLFQEQHCWDQLALAERVGAELIIIDDTGKLVSLHDAKVGILSSTHRLTQEIAPIHEQVLLNCSSMDVGLISTVLNLKESSSEVSRARNLVHLNSERFASTCAELGFEYERAGLSSVAWARVGGVQRSLLSRTESRGLSLLPGGHFFWDRTRDAVGDEHIRVALMRDPAIFDEGMRRLVAAAK